MNKKILQNKSNKWEVLGTSDDSNWYDSNYIINQLTIGKQWTEIDNIIKKYSHIISFLLNETNIYVQDSNINLGLSLQKIEFIL